MRPQAHCAAALAALSVAWTMPLTARDLGVQGQLWPIIEIDLRQALIESASRADWQSIDQQMRSSAEHFLARLPKRTTPTAAQTTTRWIDPSFIVAEDIRAPVRDAQDEWHWAVLYRKGTRLNPLSLQRPSSAILFFDGGSREQVAFASEINRRHPARVMLVEASGVDPSVIARKLKTPVFNASEQMLTRFPVRATPALLCAGDGAQALSLGLTEFARPFAAASAETVCPLLHPTAVGATP